ncbi:hypothetical protein BC832DRAFT_24124 [Gaertneriomyces semiglobifer]|nr:hypothetical protein BC832DRAFT_24124 [Gaertneriomyces semiglobifer]
MNFVCRSISACFLAPFPAVVPHSWAEWLVFKNFVTCLRSLSRSAFVNSPYEPNQAAALSCSCSCIYRLSPNMYRTVTLWVLLYILICLHLCYCSNTASNGHITLQSRAQPLPSFPSSGVCRGVANIGPEVPEGIIQVSGPDQYQVYPDNTACGWVIRSPPGTVIKLEFEDFHTECGWDFVEIYDGGDLNTTPLVGRLCGIRGLDHHHDDSFTSSGPSLALAFRSDEMISAPGFRARFKVVSRESVSEPSTGCTANHKGTLCQTDSSVDYPPPRQHHSAAYDADNNLVYLSFGTYFRAGTSQADMYTYHIGNDVWSKIEAPEGKIPGKRYMHSSWIVNGSLLVYGGVADTIDTLLHQYFPTNNTWADMGLVDWRIPRLNGAATALARNDHIERVYVVGGILDNNQISRDLFMFDLATQLWTVGLKRVPIWTWGATLTYHKQTNTLHLVGGYRYGTNRVLRRSYFYSIDADRWYNGPEQPAEAVTVFGRAEYIGDDTVAIVGGYRPAYDQNEIASECWVGQIAVYDLACGGTTLIDPPAPISKELYKRMGHALVYRNAPTPSLFAFGGTDGFLLNDVLQIPTATFHLGSSAGRTQCALRRWCNNFYDCGDCTARPYCNWCGDHCVSADLANELCTTPEVVTSPESCPAREFLDLGRPVIGSVRQGDSITYRSAYIDLPDADLRQPAFWNSHRVIRVGTLATISFALAIQEVRKR